MAVSVEDSAAVRQALAEGQITVTDPATGYHRAMFADCPNDGQPAAIHRVVRGPAHAITELIMHCSRCDREFAPSPESVYLT